MTQHRDTRTDEAAKLAASGSKEARIKDIKEKHPAFAAFPELLKPDPSYILTASDTSHAKA